ncbi:AAA family ATPase [Deltaproteobacteria bacterium TL4]
MENLKERVTKIIEHLNEGIHERNEIIAVSFLAALSDQNVFLFGPPGTAKSLIARRLSHAFETQSYFEYLMQRFSTPEEVFGPVSITELKKDHFFRKTEGFLPQSDFAFLDEIWKSSPAILNTLLTIINEKLFSNGTKTESVPLKTLIVASNETPPLGQGLEALYDRFLIRLNVPPMEEKKNFESLLQSRPTIAQLKLPEGLAIKHDEWEKWCVAIHTIQLSKETLNVIHDIRLTFGEKGKQLNIYVSDRRWQKSAILLKAAAFFCGREKTNLVDTLLLRHCLWTTKENREEVIKIIENAVRNSGFETGFSLQGNTRA